jgi:hypothetical protein
VALGSNADNHDATGLSAMMWIGPEPWVSTEFIGAARRAISPEKYDGEPAVRERFWRHDRYQ